MNNIPYVNKKCITEWLKTILLRTLLLSYCRAAVDFYKPAQHIVKVDWRVSVNIFLFFPKILAFFQTSNLPPVVTCSVDRSRVQNKSHFLKKIFLACVLFSDLIELYIVKQIFSKSQVKFDECLNVKVANYSNY